MTGISRDCQDSRHGGCVCELATLKGSPSLHDLPVLPVAPAPETETHHRTRLCGLPLCGMPAQVQCKRQAKCIWTGPVLVVKMRHDGTSVCNRTSAVP